MAPKQNRKPAPKSQPKPRPKKRKEQEEASAGSVMWRMGMLLCTGLVVVGLLFASVNGGSQYVGLEQDKTKATPTPPVETVDPMQNVEGSDITPIPPSATPEDGATTEGGTGTEQSPTP